MTKRFIGGYILLTITIILCLAIPLGSQYARQQSRDITNNLLLDAFTLESFIAKSVEGTESKNLQSIVQNYTKRTNTRMVIVDNTGILLADSSSGFDPSRKDNFSNRSEISQALQGKVSTGTRPSDTLQDDLLYVSIPISSGKTVGALRLTYTTKQLHSDIRSYWYGLTALSLLALGIAAFLGYVIAQWTLRPLYELKKTSQLIGEGNFSARSTSTIGPPEVQDVSEAFNNMANEIDLLLTKQHQFTADVAHQLRTPLTALRLQLENFQTPNSEEIVNDSNSAVSFETQFLSTREKMLAEVDRLTRVVHGLLQLARTNPDSQQRETISIATFLEERIELWSSLATEDEITLQYSAHPQYLQQHNEILKASIIKIISKETAHDDGIETLDIALCLATPDYLTQVFDNLLGNAIDASPKNTTIWIWAEFKEIVPVEPTPTNKKRYSNSTNISEPMISIHIYDEGPGLSDTERDLAFDRFWRSPNSSTVRFGGTGLGLAIAKQLVELDGGDLRLDRAITGGIDAVISYKAP